MSPWSPSWSVGVAVPGRATGTKKEQRGGCPFRSVVLVVGAVSVSLFASPGRAVSWSVAVLVGVVFCSLYDKKPVSGCPPRRAVHTDSDRETARGLFRSVGFTLRGSRACSRACPVSRACSFCAVRPVRLCAVPRGLFSRPGRGCTLKSFDTCSRSTTRNRKATVSRGRCQIDGFPCPS